MECERSSYLDTKVIGEVEVCWSRDSSAGQADPLQHMEINGGANAHLQSMEDPTPKQVTVCSEGYDSEKPILEQSVPERLHPLERTRAGKQLMQNCSPWKGLI